MSMSSLVQPQRVSGVDYAIVYDGVRLDPPTLQLFDPQWPPLCAQKVSQGGRSAAWFVNGEFGAGVLRHYHRGGLVARLSTDRYFWTGSNATRSMAEFRTLCEMHGKGLPVPRPLAAMYARSGLVYRAAILIERIPESRTLAQLVAAGGTHVSPNIAITVAETIFRMHQAGVWHADLNATNILLDAADRPWLIDFDKARHGPVSPPGRIQNMRRLRRSLGKLAPEYGDVWWKDINDAYVTLASGKNGPIA